MKATGEAAFETVVKAHLLANGYEPVAGEGFDRARAIFPETALAFVRETQPREWAKLEALLGDDTGTQVLADLCKWMDIHGSLAALRHGFKCYGRTLRIAFFKAAHGLNPELEARYAANRLGLTRQLRYSPRSEKSLDPAAPRFAERLRSDENEAELLRGKMQAFRNLYGFLSQVIPYRDSDLERLYVFLRHLAGKLPRRRRGPAYRFDDEISLEYYRLQKISEGSIALGDGEARALDGPSEVGSGAVRERPVPLSQLIDIVNERFGTDFNRADQLFFDQIVEAAVGDESLRQAAAANPADRFALLSANLIGRLFVERMDRNEDIFVRYMNDARFRETVSGWMASEAYRRLRAETAGAVPEASETLPALRAADA